MKLFLSAALLSFSFLANPVFAHANCQYGDMKSLRETWRSFRQASLYGSESPKEIAKYYKFPIKLLSPFDGEKPILISKKLFLIDYRSIFRELVPGDEIDLFKGLKKTTGDEYIPEREFDQTGCRRPPLGPIRIEDYYFYWGAKNGWLIQSAYYSGQFDLLKSSLIAKKK
jgi:hypothetical protein